MKKLFLTLALVSAGHLHAQEIAPEPDPYAIVAGFTQDLSGMSATFKQRVFDDVGRLVETSSGNVYLSEPNRFRWDYQEPYEQLIVADGQKVWVHDVELEQVTVRDQGVAESESPLSVLAQPEKLKDQYQVSGLGDGWVRLTPRSEDSQVEKVDLRFTADTLMAMDIHDSFGQRTALEFFDQARNPDLGVALFEFEPPEGADVLGDVSMPGVADQP